MFITHKGYEFPIRFSVELNFAFYFSGLLALLIQDIIIYYLFIIILFLYLNNGEKLEITSEHIKLHYPHKIIIIKKKNIKRIEIKSEKIPFPHLDETIEKTIDDIYIIDINGKIIYFNSNYFSEEDYVEIKSILSKLRFCRRNYFISSEYHSI